MGKISDEYHLYYEKNRLWEKTCWLGVPIWKNPCDLLILQEIIWSVNPDWIIETGTNYGGSALFFASLFESIGSMGKIVTIDIERKFDPLKVSNRKIRDRIKYIIGNSVSDSTVQQVKKYVKEERCMVVLDSWHSMDHVYRELELYQQFVDVGSYIIVEDTHIWNPIIWKYNDLGPGGAVGKFLNKYYDKFYIDGTREKLVWTFNPCGFLKRSKY